MNPLYAMCIIRVAFLILLGSIVLVTGCAAPKPDPQQLEQVLARTSALEQQVRALEESNAELRMEVRRLQERQVPREPRQSQTPRPPQTPRPLFPQTNGVPHLTPLETK